MISILIFNKYPTQINDISKKILFLTKLQLELILLNRGSNCKNKIIKLT